MRDCYPGVNAVTLGLVRAKPEDMEALQQLVPVVRIAVDNAPSADGDEGRYWQAATKLEVASAAQDWEAANDHLVTTMGIEAYDWMHDTTIKTSEIQQQAFEGDGGAIAAIDSLIQVSRSSRLAATRWLTWVRHRGRVHDAHKPEPAVWPTRLRFGCREDERG